MLSLGTSLFSLVIALLIALPAAWVMSQIRLPLQKLINTVLDLPMVLPPLVTGLSLLLLFGSQGWLSSIQACDLSHLGLMLVAVAFADFAQTVNGFALFG